MKSKSGNWPDRKISIRKRSVAALLLWALSFAVFPTAIFSARKALTPEGLVYCPLSKKLQPVRPPQKKPEPFDGLCASRPTKDFLFREIVVKNPWRVFTLDSNGLEKLTFDLLARGPAALEKLPAAPRAPLEKITGEISANAGAGSRSEHKFVSKRLLAGFPINLKPRPPTTGACRFFSVNPAYRAAALSRRIAPRAPPLFS